MTARDPEPGTGPAKKCVIYGLRSRGADVFHYVGFTSLPDKRLSSHIDSARSAVRSGASRLIHDWLVNDDSVKELVVLEEVPMPPSFRARSPQYRNSAAGERERYWIKKLHKEGHPLLNEDGHPKPPRKYECHTCRMIDFTNASMVASHRRLKALHKVFLTKRWPFVVAWDKRSRSWRHAVAKLPPATLRITLFRKGVECDDCGGPIYSRRDLSPSSRRMSDGTFYRSCSACDDREAMAATPIYPEVPDDVGDVDAWTAIQFGWRPND